MRTLFSKVNYFAWIGNFPPYLMLLQHLQFKHIKSGEVHGNQKVKPICLGISTDIEVSME